MKKVILVGLSAAVLFLSACGKSGSGGSNPNTYYGSTLGLGYPSSTLAGSTFSTLGGSLYGTGYYNGVNCQVYQIPTTTSCGCSLNNSNYAYYYVPTNSNNSGFSPFYSNSLLDSSSGFNLNIGVGFGGGGGYSGGSDMSFD